MPTVIKSEITEAKELNHEKYMKTQSFLWSRFQRTGMRVMRVKPEITIAAPGDQNRKT